MTTSQQPYRSSFAPEEPYGNAGLALLRVTQQLERFNKQREGLLFGASPILLTILDCGRGRLQFEAFFLIELYRLLVEHVSVVPGSIIQYIGHVGPGPGEEGGLLQQVSTEPVPSYRCFGGTTTTTTHAATTAATAAAAGNRHGREEDPAEERGRWKQQAMSLFPVDIKMPGLLRGNDPDYQDEEGEENRRLTLDMWEETFKMAVSAAGQHQTARSSMYNCHAIAYQLSSAEEASPALQEQIRRLNGWGVPLHSLSVTPLNRVASLPPPPPPHLPPLGVQTSSSSSHSIFGVGQYLSRLGDEQRTRIALRTGGHRWVLNRHGWLGGGVGGRAWSDRSLGAEILGAVSPGDWARLFSRFESEVGRPIGGGTSVVPGLSPALTGGRVQSGEKWSTMLNDVHDRDTGQARLAEIFHSASWQVKLAIDMLGFLQQRGTGHGMLLEPGETLIQRPHWQVTMSEAQPPVRSLGPVNTGGVDRGQTRAIPAIKREDLEEESNGGSLVGTNDIGGRNDGLDAVPRRYNLRARPTANSSAPDSCSEAATNSRTSSSKKRKRNEGRPAPLRRSS